MRQRGMRVEGWVGKMERADGTKFRLTLAMDIVGWTGQKDLLSCDTSTIFDDRSHGQLVVRI